MIESVFEHRDLLVATMHGKEKAIAPVLETELGVRVVIEPSYNTDRFGTFSGEIERSADPISVLREKCLFALNEFRYDLGVASEGSFGPHPTIPFAQANEELMILIDLKHGIEIVAGNLQTDTNFSAATIRSEQELLQFARKALFPEHALILRTGEKDFTTLIKGIQDEKILVEEFRNILHKNGSVYVETDMRAHMNPTRMKHLKLVTEKLLEKIKHTCTRCKMPGFDVSAVVRGLPCELCHQPTNSILKLVYQCKHCHYQEEKFYPQNKKMEDPQFCNYCNP